MNEKSRLKRVEEMCEPIGPVEGGGCWWSGPGAANGVVFEEARILGSGRASPELCGGSMDAVFHCCDSALRNITALTKSKGIGINDCERVGDNQAFTPRYGQWAFRM